MVWVPSLIQMGVLDWGHALGEVRSIILPPADLVRDAAGLIGKTDPTVWVRLPPGRSNILWRVDSPLGEFVVKLYSAPATPLFPNDPASENAALMHLHQSELSPKSSGLISGSYGKALIYQYLPGQPGFAAIQDVAKLLFHVHQTDIYQGLRRLKSGSDAIMIQVEHIMSRCEMTPQAVVDLHDELTRRSAVPQVDQVKLIHADPVPSNILRAMAGLRLIDWQCPAVGDPCEDLAIFLSPSMQIASRCDPLDMAEEALFLDAYPDAEMVVRYKSLIPFYALRMAIYAHWSCEVGRESSSRATKFELARAWDAVKNHC